jgi:hypothetical protein
LKTSLKKHFSSLAFFYRYLRYWLLLILVVSISVGLLDGLSLAMFLPLKSSSRIVVLRLLVNAWATSPFYSTVYRRWDWS